MKRSKAIIPFSHDHHHALILAQSIKKNAPASTVSKMNLNDKLDYVENNYRTELLPHFRNEENVLFPAANGKDKKLDTLIKQIIEEHSSFESAMNNLRKGDPAENLNQFGIMLEAHVRKEERTLFPLIENVLGEEGLKKLEGKIVAVKDGCDI